MEILDQFGLNPYLFGAQIINFLIIFYILKRFLYKPVLELLKKREESIKRGLEQAEEGKLLLDKALVREKEILKKAHEKSKETIAEAKIQAELVSKKLEEETKKQSQKILDQARIQIEMESKETEKRLASKITTLSIDYLSKSLKDVFSEKDQKDVLEKALKEINKN